MEFPLIPVLARMECAGVSLDLDHLEGMSKEMDRQLQALVIDIHRDAEASSTSIRRSSWRDLVQQVEASDPAKDEDRLFHRRERAGILRGQHPIIDRLLEFRQITKLKSTYVTRSPR